MNKLLTKMAIFGSGAIMFAGVALANTSVDPGMGAGNLVGNAETGYHSVNFATLHETNKVDVDNNNFYRVNNDLDLSLKTGYNDVTNGMDKHGHWAWNNDRHGWTWEHDGEGGSGSIDTGNAMADITIMNEGNSSTTHISSATSGGTTVTNDTTGAKSENRAKAVVFNGTYVDNNNTACVTNDLNVTASTGSNDVSYDTGSASIVTGDAEVSISISNDLNSNHTEIGQ